MSPAVLFCLVVLGLFGVHSAVLTTSSTDTQNEEFDSLIKNISSQINSSNTNSLSLPSLSLAGGLLTATNGELKDFGTMQRVGNATMTASSTGYEIAGAITFDTLELDFDEFSISLGLFSIGGGSASVTFSSNEIDVDIAATIDLTNKNCTITINTLKVSKLSGAEITFGTWSIINWVIQMFAPFYVNTFSTTLISLVGDNVSNVAQTFLDNVNLCG